MSEIPVYNENPTEEPRAEEDVPSRESGITRIVGFSEGEQEIMSAKTKEVFEDQIEKALEHKSGKLQ